MTAKHTPHCRIRRLLSVCLLLTIGLLLFLFPRTAHAAKDIDWQFRQIKQGNTSGYELIYCNVTPGIEVVIPASGRFTFGTTMPIISIGKNAFKNSAAKSVFLPETITKIGYAAFANSDITHISIPDSIVEIDDSAFDNCPNLAYTTYDNAKYLGNATNPYVLLIAAVSTDITQCTIHPDTKIIFGKAFRDCVKLTQITIPDKVVSINSTAFYGCTGITQITIPDSVVSIHYTAFTGCSNLTSFKIGKSLKDFTGTLFGCPKLTGFQVSPDNPYFSTDAFGILFNKDKTILLAAPDILSGSYTVPSSVKRIGASAFDNCTDLTEVIFWGTLEHIGTNAFRGCNKLRFNTTYGSNYFKTDAAGVLYTATVHGLELIQAPTTLSGHYTVPDNVIIIRSYAFSGCTGLESVFIPATVLSTGHFTFDGCTGLKTVTYGGTQQSWNRTKGDSGSSKPLANLKDVNLIFLGDQEATTPTTQPTTPTTQPTTPAPTQGNHEAGGNTMVIAMGAVIIVLALLNICTVAMLLKKKTA